MSTATIESWVAAMLEGHSATVALIAATANGTRMAAKTLELRDHDREVLTTRPLMPAPVSTHGFSRHRPLPRALLGCRAPPRNRSTSASASRSTSLCVPPCKPLNKSGHPMSLGEARLLWRPVQIDQRACQASNSRETSLQESAATTNGPHPGSGRSSEGSLVEDSRPTAIWADRTPHPVRRRDLTVTIGVRVR